ncbi:MAG: hypothetical protein E6H66_04245 [Betaproteobacteria bacterium]|nr:MAG: hypothetical protein E6H66_04245 [Betaproteobacteria bacterium]
MRPGKRGESAQRNIERREALDQVGALPNQLEHFIDLSQLVEHLGEEASRNACWFGMRTRQSRPRREGIAKDALGRPHVTLQDQGHAIEGFADDAPRRRDLFARAEPR